MDFPTAHHGNFSFWGLGAMDAQSHDALMDTSDWKSAKDKNVFEHSRYIGVMH